MKKLCLLGSTGSIGTQTIDIIKRHGGYEVYGLAALRNIDRLEEQTRSLRPQKVCVYDEEAAAAFSTRVRDLEVEVLTGMEGLCELASDPQADLVVTAVVGMIGIRPTIAAITAGHDVALANKETLVTAGHIIMPLAAEHHIRLLPIDSEHSAIFQCLQGRFGPQGIYAEEHESNGRSVELNGTPVYYPGAQWIDKILLTASGGPFRGMSYAELQTKTAEDALKHPNWSMGPKITVDSASMVNKALEVIEAKWLFGVEPDDIEVVIQPRSIIHSAVQFRDGAVIAQLGCPDMRLPIQYALYYPKRMDCPAEKISLFDIAHIDFERPDYETFRGLALGLEALKCGGSMCTAFNAANEYAVAQFLAGRIGFTDIYDIIQACMEHHESIAFPTLEQILETEREVREHAAAVSRK